MIAIGGDRTALLNVFAGRVSPRDDGTVVSSVSDFAHTEIIALFGDDAQRGDFPHTIVVAADNLHDFFAWAATYLAHWSPLTAGVRVIRKSAIEESFAAPCHSVQWSANLRRAFASLAAGEVLCEWKLAGEKSNPNVLSLRSTFAYVAIQSLRRNQLDLGALYDSWDRAQRVLNLARRRIERQTFLNVWEPIVNCLSAKPKLTEDYGEVSRALAETMATMQLPLQRVKDGAPLFADTEPRGPTEKREDAVVELEKWLLSGRSERPMDKFGTACLATQISPGALTHFDVLAGMTKAEPESLLWYSFLSGLLASEPSPQIVERLLFKVASEFPKDLRPRHCDVSLDELQVLVQPDGFVPLWVGIGAGFFVIELRDGVCAYFRVRDRAPTVEGSGPDRSQPQADAQLFEELLQQLRTLYRRRVEPVQRKRRRK